MNERGILESSDKEEVWRGMRWLVFLRSKGGIWCAVVESN